MTGCGQELELIYDELEKNINGTDDVDMILGFANEHFEVSDGPEEDLSYDAVLRFVDEHFSVLGGDFVDDSSDDELN